MTVILGYTCFFFVRNLNKASELNAKRQILSQTPNDRFPGHFLVMILPNSRIALDLVDLLAGHELELMAAVFKLGDGIGTNDVAALAEGWPMIQRLIKSIAIIKGIIFMHGPS